MDIIIALVSLIALEVVLGIDNIVFISIMAKKLPANQQNKLRHWGIGLAMIMRLLLLTVIAWILKLNTPLFTISTVEFSGKSLILLIGGLFLLYKSTKEIYHHTEAAKTESNSTAAPSFRNLLIEVILLDLVFSIDSIITAVGMVDQVWIMYVSVIITVLIMLWASKPIYNFIHQHPSFKILALCFLMIIGVSLIAEGLGLHIPKGYIYFGMFFSLFVDVIQMKTKPNKV